MGGFPNVVSDAPSITHTGECVYDESKNFGVTKTLAVWSQGLYQAHTFGPQESPTKGDTRGSPSLLWKPLPRRPSSTLTLPSQQSDSSSSTELFELKPSMPLSKHNSQRRPVGCTYGTSFSACLRDWWFELLSWVTSALCMAAIAAVLIVYDGKPIPSLPLGITLNTYTSVVSSVVKAALLIPTAEVLGQSKWEWFRKPQRLSDFEALDDASRGPWGALTLLLRRRCR